VSRRLLDIQRGYRTDSEAELVVVKYFHTFTGRDIELKPLWFIRVGGYFYVIPGREVVFVEDKSTFWTDDARGWRYHVLYRRVRVNRKYGEVRIRLRLAGPAQSIVIEAWARVWRNLQTEGDKEILQET